MRYTFALLWFVSAAVVTPTVRAEEPLFPFLVSYDTPSNATNISAWLAKPTGIHGRVRIVDGQLATDHLKTTTPGVFLGDWVFLGGDSHRPSLGERRQRQLR